MDQLQTQQVRSEIRFNELNEAGAYVNKQGELMRVQDEALKEGHSPLITITSKLDTRVIKISDDPNIPVGKARVLAADADIAVNF